jgi:hypothetical protein
MIKKKNNHKNNDDKFLSMNEEDRLFEEASILRKTAF